MLLGGRTADLLRPAPGLPDRAGRVRAVLRARRPGRLAGWVLVLARFVTGVAAGFMAPAGLSASSPPASKEGPLRDRAVVIYGGDRRRRLHARHGGRRAADHGELALGVLRTGACCGALLLVAGRALIRRRRDSPGRRPRGFDLVGAVTRDGGDGRGGLRAGGPRRGATTWPVGRRRWCWPRSCSRCSCGTSVAPQRRSCASASSGTPALARTNLAGLLYMGCLLRLPVPRHALPPGPARLVAARDRADLRRSWASTWCSHRCSHPSLVRRFGNVPRHGWPASLSATLAFVLFLRLDDDWGYLQMLPMLVLRRRRVRPRLRSAHPRRHRRASRSPSRAWPAACSTRRSSSAPRSGWRW